MYPIAILDLRETSSSPANSRVDEKGFLSGREISEDRLTTEKEFFRCSGLYGVTGILRKSSILARMKLYLSSYRIAVPDELFRLVGREPNKIKVALLPNAKDYYAPLAQDYKIRDIIRYQNDLGLMSVDIVDLRTFADSVSLYEKLKKYDLVWAVGGNTFCLRQEMKRSKFDQVIHPLLDEGVVYGGDSAGAVVAGTSLRGIESVDIPEFTEEVIYEGLRAVPYVLLPHADNEYFKEANEQTKQAHDGDDLISLDDNQAAIFENDTFRIVSSG
ncbi:hypothetical protein BH23PAT2_BH23PAT2_02080 [soil metagenome]